MFDLFNEIAQTLRHNKLRTALTGLSVAWGVFMLVVLLGMAEGVTRNFKDFNEESGNKLIQLWGGLTSKSYKGNREGRFVQFRTSDIDRIENKGTRFGSEVIPVIYGTQETISSGGRSVKQSYSGLCPGTERTEHLTIVEGRFITSRDMDEKAHVMVISDEIASQLFPNTDYKNVLGKRVDCKGLSFQIVGVFHCDWNRSCMIPYATARLMQSDPNKIGSLKVNVPLVSDEADGKEAEDLIRNTLAKAHNFDPDDESALWVSNHILNGLQAQSAIGILNIAVWVLGLLSLLSGIIGISNIMFVSVKERTHEIGIRRAIGARPRSILIQVIAEAVAITTLFGYIGIVLGTVVTQIIAHFTVDIINPTVSLPLALEVTAVLVIAGALAGFFPALKALKIKPVEALSDE